jgi:hypothetical protein
MEVCGIYGLKSGVAYTITVASTDPNASGDTPAGIATPN